LALGYASSGSLCVSFSPKKGRIFGGNWVFKLFVVFMLAP
jgi:hypothetical protein